MPVRSEIEGEGSTGRVARIIFSDAKANCFTTETLVSLEAQLRAFGSRPDIGAVGLESEGAGAFSAGASFDEFKALASESDAADFFFRFAKVMLAIRDLPVFFVVRCHGKAVGGALGILAAADFVCASPEAEIRLSEITLGIGPFVIGPALERKIGLAAFQDLTVGADWKSASWAEQRGFFNKLLPSRAELETTYRSELARVAVYDRQAVTAVKAMLWEGSPTLEAKLRERAATVARLLMEKKGATS